jgi:hypothetical protein
LSDQDIAIRVSHLSKMYKVYPRPASPLGDGDAETSPQGILGSTRHLVRNQTRRRAAAIAASDVFKKILLPVDLTDKHLPALDVAADLAKQSGGEVLLLHVIEVISGLSMEEERDFYGRLEKRAPATHA